MSVNSITLMEAYLIEHLRNNGMSDEEILNKVKEKDVDSLQKIKPNLDFNGLIELYGQDEQAFESIMSDGYRVKFLTFNGLKNLLNIKFKKVEEEDYQLLEKGITGLYVTEDELNAIRIILSNNWKVQEEETDQDGQRKVSIVL